MADVNVKEQLNGESHDSAKQDGVATENVEQKSKDQPQNLMNELDRIQADSLKDIEVFDDDGDDDDPDLSIELSHIIHPEEVQQVAAVDLSINTNAVQAPEVAALLKQRIEMYKTAETNAKSANETMRARRFARGLSTLETMMNDVLAAKAINMEDIPPEVMTKVKDTTPSDLNK